MSDSRAPRILEAGINAFAVTTGVILAFGYGRGGMLLPFIRVGRRVVREITLPSVGDATIGLIVHFGQSLALGAIAVFLAGSGELRMRIRAALITVALWQLAALLPWFAAIRADVSLNLSTIARAGIALLLIAALALGSRARLATAPHSHEPATLD